MGLNVPVASKKEGFNKEFGFQHLLYKLSNTFTHTIDILLDDVSPFLKHVSEVNVSNANVLALQILFILWRVTDHGEADTEKGRKKKTENPHKVRKKSS